MQYITQKTGHISTTKLEKLGKDKRKTYNNAKKAYIHTYIHEIRKVHHTRLNKHSIIVHNEYSF